MLLLADMGEAGMVAAMLAITLAVLKFAGRALDQRDAKRARESGEDPLGAILALLKKVYERAEEAREISQTIFDMHNKKDEDGIYAWWVPRAWHKLLTQMVEAISELKTLTARQTDLTDRIAGDQRRAQDETNRRLERIEKQNVLILERLNSSDFGKL